MGLFARSHTLLGTAWQIFKTKKNLIWLPAWAIITSISFSFLVMLANMLANFISGHPSPTQANNYLSSMSLIIALLSAVVSNYFFGAGINSTAQILRTKTNQIRASLSYTLGYILPITLWATINSSLYYLPDYISPHPFNSSFTFIKIVLFFMWNIATCFVVPFIILENAPVLLAIKNSLGLIKKVWAEYLLVMLEITLLLCLAVILGGLLAFLGLQLLHYLQPWLSHISHAAYISAQMLMGMIGFAYFFALLLISWVVCAAFITVVFYTTRGSLNGKEYSMTKGA